MPLPVVVEHGAEQQGVVAGQCPAEEEADDATGPAHAREGVGKGCVGCWCCDGGGKVVGGVPPAACVCGLRKHACVREHVRQILWKGMSQEHP